MKKKLPLVLSMILLSTILLGCQSEDSVIKDVDKNKLEQQTGVVIKTETVLAADQQSEEGKENLKIDGAITKISILKDNKTIVLDDDKSIGLFDSLFTSAVKESGIVNMTNPEFKLEVVYANDNKQRYHLWLGEKSTLMKTDETHTIYTVSEAMTDEIIELIESQYF